MCTNLQPAYKTGPEALHETPPRKTMESFWRALRYRRLLYLEFLVITALSLVGFHRLTSRLAFLN